MYWPRRTKENGQPLVVVDMLYLRDVYAPSLLEGGLVRPVRVQRRQVVRDAVVLTQQHHLQ